MTRIATKRLLLRLFTAADRDVFQAIAGDWHVARMTADLPHPLSAEAAASWLEPEENCVRFAIEREGETIGGAGYFVHCLDSDEKRSGGVLGFFLARTAWGQGFAAEAVGALLHHGFEKDALIEFTSSHFVDNAPSAKVLLKLGFVQMGGGTAWCRARGEMLRSISYRLTKTMAAGLGYCAAHEIPQTMAEPGEKTGRHAQRPAENIVSEIPR